jgi:uncharacterized protein YciW
MKNINTLREKMSATVAALESKSISAEEAMAISRAAAVVIGSLRVELQYRQMRAEKPEIEFLDSHNDPGLATAPQRPAKQE